MTEVGFLQNTSKRTLGSLAKRNDPTHKGPVFSCVLKPAAFKKVIAGVEEESIFKHSKRPRSAEKVEKVEKVEPPAKKSKNQEPKEKAEEPTEMEITLSGSLERYFNDLFSGKEKKPTIFNNIGVNNMQELAEKCPEVAEVLYCFRKYIIKHL